MVAKPGLDSRESSAGSLTTMSDEEARDEETQAQGEPPSATVARTLTPIEDRLDELAKLKEEALHAGSEAAAERQHKRGKLTVRERIDLFVDPGTFVELDMLARHRAVGFGIENSRPLTDGVVTGWGMVDGRKVFLFAQDFTIFGGALGEVYAQKIHKVMDLAESVGAPVVGLNDGGGARIQEGVVSLDAYGGIFFRNVKASGVVPQISVVLGPCAGGAVYSPAMTDFIFMVKGTSLMFITGPEVVKSVTGEDVTQEQLGGAMTHATKSGVATFVADDEQSCLQMVRYLLSFLPSNNLEDPPYYAPTDDPDRSCDGIPALMPDASNKPYDMKKVIAEVVDDGDFFEVFPLWAMNIVCGFARIDGHVVGIVGNQPQVFAGCLDIEASEKAGRFVRTCDAFNIPLLTFVDVPGYRPGTDQEYGGIIRHGAKILYAYCEATVPRIQIITRKGYGGAYVSMNSKSIGADLAFAWPSAEIAVMGPAPAVGIIFRKEIESADDPEARRQELVDDYTDRLANPYAAAERGFVDDVIDPRDTRRVLVKSLQMLRTKREQLPQRKHGNGPL
ncbi:MAG: acetyl-CoA carboxylase, carboxyltransferase component (subunit alpha and beta) [Actinomycetia bacterium]|nr:acetyl-CoA carboxylase, carboxyltransferase component (subunit alpha and beta) [Actinomycetes bacterium]